MKRGEEMDPELVGDWVDSAGCGCLLLFVGWGIFVKLACTYGPMLF